MIGGAETEAAEHGCGSFGQAADRCRRSGLQPPKSRSRRDRRDVDIRLLDAPGSGSGVAGRASSCSTPPSAPVGVPLCFANAGHVEERIHKVVEAAVPTVRWLVLDASAYEDLNAGSEETLARLQRDLAARAVTLVIAGASAEVQGFRRAASVRRHRSGSPRGATQGDSPGLHSMAGDERALDSSMRPPGRLLPRTCRYRRLQSGSVATCVPNADCIPEHPRSGCSTPPP